MSQHDLNEEVSVTGEMNVGRAFLVDEKLILANTDLSASTTN